MARLRFREKNECGKLPYKSESIARQLAHRRMKENRTVILRPYFCNRCGHWHITHQEDRFRVSEEDY
jgi:hypothetical protein